jgi:hypothetical protein
MEGNFPKKAGLRAGVATFGEVSTSNKRLKAILDCRLKTLDVA